MLSDREKEIDEEELKAPRPPSEDELEDFMKNEVGGPTLENFRLDFREGKTKGVWNHRAAAIFARAYNAHGRYAHQKKADVEKSFLSHLRTIRTRYLRQQNSKAPKTRKQRDDEQRKRRRNRRETVSCLPSALRLLTNLSADIPKPTESHFPPPGPHAIPPLDSETRAERHV